MNRNVQFVVFIFLVVFVVLPNAVTKVTRQSFTEQWLRSLLLPAAAAEHLKVFIFVFVSRQSGMRGMRNLGARIKVEGFPHVIYVYARVERGGNCCARLICISNERDLQQGGAR